MIIQESVLKTKVGYSEDKENRYLLTKEWDEALPKAVVVMLIPGSASNVQQDVTTGCVINCSLQLGFGGVDIVNLFSKLDVEISTDIDIGQLTDEENDKVILDVVDRASTVVLAWGKCDETNLKIKQRVEQVMKLIEPFGDKLYLIGDGRGRSGFSPMYPRIRNKWELVKYYQKEHTETNSTKKSKKAK